MVWPWPTEVKNYPFGRALLLHLMRCSGRHQPATELPYSQCLDSPRLLMSSAARLLCFLAEVGRLHGVALSTTATLYLRTSCHIHCHG